MELKDKIKELRTERKMTQEEVARFLSVSSQTVSKWERGLVQPDLSVLPKLAILFRCSIDSLFDMELTWGEEHRKEFYERCNLLHKNKEYETEWSEWIKEIKLNPDTYAYYVSAMELALTAHFFETDRIKMLLSLAQHADQHCTDDEKRNEIFRNMVMICSKSDDPAIREKAKYYYQKLPFFRHGREFSAKYVLPEEEDRREELKTLIHLIIHAARVLRHLAKRDLPPEEQLYYYKKAAALYETVLEGKYGGVYEEMLVANYGLIAQMYVRMGENEKAAEYVQKMLFSMDRYLTETDVDETSPLLFATTWLEEHANSTEYLYYAMCNNSLRFEEFDQFKEELTEMRDRFVADFNKEGKWR